MPDTIPNLWPNEIKVAVLSPYAILSAQAGLLGKVTRGILDGTVETETGRDKVQHRLVVVAPAYHSYRHTLVTALHDPNLPYPVEVRAEGMANRVKQEESLFSGPLSYVTVYPKAYDDDQMLGLVKRALQSEQTRAAIVSLIAKSNDATLPTPRSGSGIDQSGQNQPERQDAAAPGGKAKEGDNAP